ncbi:hypothetical protein BJV82DRAFT_672067 [Fennellomyces sp. T-0311]|nr:hypothetical protein BJV82DRAFT_672067 [Fennellomyces sp. T-0311]
MTQSAVHLEPLPVYPGDAFSRLTATTLDTISACTAFDEGKRAYAAHDYNEAIQFYTHALEALQSDLLSAIYCIAPPHMKWTRNAYFIQANALLLQNKVSDAARVYEKGAQCVPETCSQHQVLVARRDELFKEIGSRNESIAVRIPLEVVCKILSYLPMDSRFQLASTCRYWYNFLLHDWNGMWSIIDAAADYVPKGYPAICCFLQAVSPNHVEEVILDISEMYDVMPTLNTDHPKEQASVDRSQYIAAAMIQSNWNNIRSLTIKHLKEEPYYDILDSSKNTLEQLEIHSVGRNDCIAVSDAATACSNLRLVTYHITGNTRSFEFHVSHAAVDSANDINNALGMILVRKHNTLEMLKVDSAFIDLVGVLGPLTLYGAHQLRTLDLKQPFGSVVHVYLFLTACRSLQTVTLRGTFFWNDTILKALSELPLRELTMIANNGETADDLLPPENAMQAAEQALISLVKDIQTLRNLAVNYGSSFRLSDDFLLRLTSAIATDSHVVELDFQNIAVSDSHLISMLSNLKNSQVRKLSFQKATTVSTRVLRILGLAIGAEHPHTHYADDDHSLVSSKLEDILFSRESRRLVNVKPSITDLLHWRMTYHWDELVNTL